MSALQAVSPSPAPETAPAPARDYLTIALGQDLFALPVDLVHEVLDPPPVTRIPNAPSFAPGLVNVRGKVLPLLDLRARFGLEEASNTETTRVIVSEVPAGDGRPFEIAIRTDAVFEVVPVRADEIAAVPEHGVRWPTEFLRGVVRRAGNFVVLLDVERLADLN